MTPGLRAAAPARLGVFCGARDGRDPVFRSAAEALGRLMASADIGLVTGGARIGLMGTVADAVLAGGGEVTGVIPKVLHLPGIVHTSLSRLEVVDDMHARKARMSELCDGFIALPGGLGTLEELFEAWTWSQMGIRRMPIGVLDTGGFYQPLLSHIAGAAGEDFLAEQDRGLVTVDDDPARLLQSLIHRHRHRHRHRSGPAAALREDIVQ